MGRSLITQQGNLLPHFPSLTPALRDDVYLGGLLPLEAEPVQGARVKLTVA